ncbi:type II toxin-antitoxin system RelE/ParE family toxin [Pseudomonas putida]|nr:type II toxin-antitoxin system mRNA interferase toxin, RelE/StbE family [Pseudomonas putida]
MTPTLYKSGRSPGTREIVVRSNYVMIYRVMDDRIEIIRILHARQQWP